MSDLLLALVTLVVPGTALAGAYATGRLAAAWLGVPEFRIMQAGSPNTRFRRLGVRTASVLGAFVVCFLAGFVAAMRLGTQHPTMTVNVLDGPAQAAGVEDGDRIVALDGKPHADWEALRADIQTSTGPRTLSIERNGGRSERVVTPRNGRIGIEPQTVRRPSGIGDATRVAVRLAVLPLHHFDPRPRPERVVVVSPREYGDTIEKSGVDEFAAWLSIGAVYAAYTWLAVAAFHAFDALLLFFRRGNE